MLYACWSAKGGAGTTVVASSLAVVLARTHPAGALLVDLGGDAPAALGCARPAGDGLVGWLAQAEAEAGGGSGSGATAGVLAPARPPSVQIGPGLHLLARGPGLLPATARSPVPLEVLAADPRAVVVDCGTLDEGSAAWTISLAGAASRSLLVTRLCYLALRRAARAPLRPSGLVVVAEPGRSLRPLDAAAVVGAPVLAELGYDPAVARAVDAGLLATRLPAVLARAAEGLLR